ncbi:hypothetical protein AB0P32_19965 [Streptomyces sp. NPDC085995]
MCGERSGAPASWGWVDDLYSHAWTLDQAAEAYAWFDRQADGKGVFEFTD